MSAPAKSSFLPPSSCIGSSSQAKQLLKVSSELPLPTTGPEDGRRVDGAHIRGLESRRPGQWQSCNIEAFTSNFGFRNGDGQTLTPTESPASELPSTPSSRDGRQSICVRHQRLQADYMRSEIDERGPGAAASSDNGSIHQVAGGRLNLKEALSSISPSPSPLLGQTQVQRHLDLDTTFDIFANASHSTRALILQGILNTSCYSQLALVRDSLGLSVESPLPTFSSTGSKPMICGTSPAAAQSSPQRSIVVNGGHFSRIAKYAFPSPARTDPYHILPPELITRFKSMESGFRGRYTLEGGLPAKVRFDLAQPALPQLPDLVRSKERNITSISKDQFFRCDPEEDMKAGEGEKGKNEMFFRGEGSGNRLASQSRISPSSGESYWKASFQSCLYARRNWDLGKPASVHVLNDGSGSSVGRDGGLHYNELRLPEGSVSIVDKKDVQFSGHTGVVRALQFDTVKLITGSLDGSMKIWDRRTGRCVRTLRVEDVGGGGGKFAGESEGVVCLAFDDTVLVSGTTDGVIRVWDVKRGCVGTLSGANNFRRGSKSVTAVALWKSTSAVESSREPLEHEKRYLLSSSMADCTIDLWHLGSKTCLRTFQGHLAPVTSLSVCGQPGGGTRLISSSMDNSLRIFDLSTGLCIHVLLGHTQGVVSVGTEGHSGRVVSASLDGTLKIWDGVSGECVSTIGGGHAISCIAVSENGVVSGGKDGKVVFWDFGA
ncbi:WD40-repeat-containing domain protein [Ephemerocybe angulata]|uniref:WD40-repeat-containing domain protein n=1 Tax=Ephemerocybe angulata TaxID=980116 RepID=A0A8H6M5D8_9AGAR|nr:WD40-repeat-containing domain protein [Tulosesus angulatus]